MQKGDIIFTYPTNLYGRLIAWATRSPFSHVALYAGDGYIIESNAFVRTRQIYRKDFYDEYEIMTHPTLSEEEREAIVAYAIERIGARYDYLQILAIIIRMITGLHISLFDQPHRYICTELIGKAYASIGVSLLPHIPTDSVSPSELRLSYILRLKQRSVSSAQKSKGTKKDRR